MNDAFKDFVEVVADDYYSIGIESGHEALGNLSTDLFLGRLDESLAEFGTPSELAPQLFWQVMLKYAEAKKIYVPVSQFYDASPKMVQPIVMY